MSNSSSGVRRGYGTTVRVGRGDSPIAWLLIRGTEDAQFPDQTPDDIDASWHGSPNDTEESIPGMKKAADFNLPLQYVPGSPADLLLTELENSGEKIILEITPAGGASHRWVAYLKSYRMTSSTAKDKQMAEAVFRVSARLPTIPAAAPVNTILPAIAGVPQVGQPLNAWPGNWETPGSFTFQWQARTGAAWAAIAGANAARYTPVAGDVGKALRVIVTSTSGAGATPATSAETINTIAA